MEIEQNQDLILRLCWLVEQQRRAELPYNRAKWQLSYHKKAGASLQKINEIRLKVLDKQKNLLDVRKKLQPKIGIVKNKLKAILHRDDGMIIGIKYPINVRFTALEADWLYLNAKQIATMADEYEARKVLNKVLA